MIAYKGFTKDMTARLGSGRYQFEPGKTAVEESSKTVRSGFHCCENPFECLAYYPLGGGNRYWLVRAEGSIDEDEGERIACTELTPVQELSLKEFAGHGMMYMVKHPMRDGWKQDRHGLQVAGDRAEAGRGGIAIARGPAPRARGAEGAVLGLILEPEAGRIAHARLMTVAGQQAGRWFTVDKAGNLKEAEDEEKGS